MDEQEINTFEPISEPNPPDERLLNMIADLTVRIEKLENFTAEVKKALPQIPW